MNDKGEAIITRALSVTTHTARHSGITNMYLSHKFTIIQMMHVSDHKPQKTFLDYIKLSSDEIADEIAVMSKKDGEMWRISLIYCLSASVFEDENACSVESIEQAC